MAKVPLVAQSDIFDLSVGSADVRPDSEMGYAAARTAFESPNYRDGNYGAGCGASVGKAGGMETAFNGLFNINLDAAVLLHLVSPIQ